MRACVRACREDVLTSVLLAVVDVPAPKTLTRIQLDLFPKLFDQSGCAISQISINGCCYASTDGSVGGGGGKQSGS